MTTNVCEARGTVEAFPPAAQDYLKAFYNARGVRLDDTTGKIKALRDANGLMDAIIAADGAVGNDEEELRILEFYVLTKQRII